MFWQAWHWTGKLQALYHIELCSPPCMSVYGLLCKAAQHGVYVGH